MPRPAFAYLFERFPSFTQTFTVREAQGVSAQGLEPRIYSIRRPEGEPLQDFPEAISQLVRYLPEPAEMRAEIRRLKDAKELPREVAKTLRELNEAGDTADKTRFYEAAWLGLRLREEGIRHVHVHFAGIAARTAYWLKTLYGFSFSFTAHANDFFVKGDYKITLEDLVREAAFVVHVSEYGLAEMQRHYLPGAAKLVCVYNGLDLEVYSAPVGPPECLPPAWIGPDAPPLILSVGRLIEKKGFSDLIAACGKLREAGFSVNLAIGGEGPLHDALQSQITLLDLADHVLLLGNQPQDEIRRLLAGCTVFALACVTESDGGKDNLPTVITEALAFRKPVVSTRLAGVPEQVADGVTGLLAEPGDITGLTAALRRLLSDPALRRQMGDAGLERARERFAIQVTTARLAEALITRGQARPSLAQAWKRPWLLPRALGL